MSQALRTLRRLSAKPLTKTRLEEVIPTGSPKPWRTELAGWSEDDRFAWEERVAIMLDGCGLLLAPAEEAAFLDASLYLERETTGENPPPRSSEDSYDDPTVPNDRREPDFLDWCDEQGIERFTPRH